jgi:hypothetical protein
MRNAENHADLRNDKVIKGILIATTAFTVSALRLELFSEEMEGMHMLNRRYTKN